ncbi:hypothetical protein R3Q06_33895 [Rhodococcus erythropolis]|uniref:hypothetical protein n=1 Tax=Rhodococcus erythropolis TaxID=1833 RepID=UPI00294A8F1C|nr:hypothetical protein [Rhodococcus erythropolis]MDV6278419.1 hypothetical protein [Rhodococcus erythropolis]
MTDERVPEAGVRSSTRPRLFTHEDKAMYLGAEESLRQGDCTDTVIGNAVAARGYAGATNASYDYHLRWSAKVAATHGFWRKLKVIVIG